MQETTVDHGTVRVRKTTYRPGVASYYITYDHFAERQYNMLIVEEDVDDLIAALQELKAQKENA